MPRRSSSAHATDTPASRHPACEPQVIVVNRFRVPEAEQAEFRGDLERAVETLAAQQGYVGGRIGRNVDDPELWVLTTEWEGAGDYRRALSSYDVKATAVPTLSRAVDEPSAYERVLPGEVLNLPGSRWLG
jgi:quinol monooxygenase YgiN